MMDFHYDCDPGQDDAVALLYALSCPGINITSISVVGGNAVVENCARNAMKILALAGRNDIPVYAGAQNPVSRPLVTLPEVFGEDGLAGGEKLLLPPRGAEQQGAVDFLSELLASSERPVGICATGPLTNLALVLLRDPGLAGRIGQLVLMGGCPYPEPLRGEMGNFTPAGATGRAEYNFAVDPEAAEIVLSAGIADVVMIGLNVTRAVLYDGRLDGRLRQSGMQIAVAAADILSAVGREDKLDYRDLWQYENDPVRAMHDVLSFAWIDRPDMFSMAETHLVCTANNPQMTPGMTIPHSGGVGATTSVPVRVARSVDADAFRDRFITVLTGKA